MRNCKLDFTSDFNRASVDGFAKSVDSLAHVGAGVFGVGVQDVERNKSKIVSCPETMSGLDGLAVEEPLDPQVGIVDGLESALKVNPGLFRNSFCIVERGREHRLHQGNLALSRPCSISHLQVSQLVETISVKSIEKKSGFGADVEAAAGRGLSDHVDRVAGVGAAVLCVGVEDVQSDESKVVGRPETMALGNGLAVAKPLNLGKWH